MSDPGIRRAALLGTVLLLALLPSNVPAAALPLLRDEWHASGSTMGLVVGAYQLGYAAAVLVVLPLTDRIAARTIVLASLALTAAASLAIPALGVDPLSAAVLRVVAGAGLAGVYMPGVRVVAATASPRRRGLAVGLYVSAFYMGSSLSLLLTGLLLRPIGWRGAALALGAAAAAAIVVAAVAGIARDRPHGRARLDPGVLREPRLGRTILAYSGHSWELYVTRGWLAAFLAVVVAHAGVPSVDAAAAGSEWAAIMLAFGVIGVPLGGLLSDRAGRVRAAAGFALASGVLAAALGLLETAPWIVIVIAGSALGLLISADSAIYSTAVAESVPPDRLGSAQAIQASLGFVTGAVAPAVAGAALDLGLGWIGVFATGGAASVLAAAIMAGYVPGRSRPWSRAKSSASGPRPRGA